MASSITRPQSSAAPRSPLSTAGYTSPLKYASNYPPTQLHSDPNAVFASESRKFLSSRKGERSYTSEDQQRQRSGSYSASSVGAASPESHYHRGLPPPPPDRMYNGNAGPTQQQILAAEMGRPRTAIPRNEATSPRSSIYPSHMLPPSSASSRSKNQSTIGPFSTYRDPSSQYHDSSIEDPYASHRRFRSPLHSPTPSSVTSSTNSASSPPSSQPQSPTHPLQHVSHQQHAYAQAPSHGRTHSSSANTYATDYAGGSSRLLPRGLSSKRDTQGYPSSHSNGYSNGLGLGAVGPALAQNIPPVLPRPPSVKGTSSSGLRRSDSLGRNGTARKGEKTVTDEEQAAYKAVNTYR